MRIHILHVGPYRDITILVAGAKIALGLHTEKDCIKFANILSNDLKDLRLPNPGSEEGESV